MNIIDELDKLLSTFVTSSKKATARVSLADIKRIDVDSLNLPIKARYRDHDGKQPVADVSTKLAKLLPAALGVTEADLDPRSCQRSVSTDLLLLNVLNQLVLSKLAKSPVREMSAKLLICDQGSYNALIKMNHILASGLVSTRGTTNLIFKHPFNVTAVLLLSDLLNSFDSHREPIVLRRFEPNLGKEAFAFNYPPIRKVLPYLKMCDLIVLLKDKVSDANKTNILQKFTREKLILEYLAHFARTTQLLNLAPLDEYLGLPHPIYNNVLTITQATSSDDILVGQPYSKLAGSQLMYTAERLVQLADRLCLDLRSVSYRSADPYSQTRAFARFVETSFKSKQTSGHIRGAKVLILDRFHDIQSPLAHADRYGPFLEQEHTNDDKDSELAANNRLGQLIVLDNLDEQLHLQPLTDVLGTIIRHSAVLKTTTKLANEPKTKPLANAMATSQSARRHLDMVKVIYKRLQEGYLLMIRLESSLLSIGDEIRRHDSLNVELQQSLAEKFQRSLYAFRNLIDVSGKTIKTMDLIRLACIIGDLINMFEHATKKAQAPGCHVILNEAKKHLSETKEFIKSVKAENKDRQSELKRQIKIIDTFVAFSKSMCPYRSKLSLTQLIEEFLNVSRPNQSEFQKINLGNSPLNLRVAPIVVFLGSLSHEELARVKALEATLRDNKSIDNIYILVCNLAKSEEFLLSMPS